MTTEMNPSNENVDPSHIPANNADPEQGPDSSSGMQARRVPGASGGRRSTAGSNYGDWRPLPDEKLRDEQNGEGTPNATDANRDGSKYVRPGRRTEADEEDSAAEGSLTQLETTSGQFGPGSGSAQGSQGWLQGSAGQAPVSNDRATNPESKASGRTAS